jgi:Prokaryotic membrane lipoprotein lipid attachment site
MKKSTVLFDFLLLFIMVALTGCSVVSGIFQAGMGFGIIMVVLVVALIIWLISRVGRKS